ncbi:secreted protein [Legionella gratiana]|uniref:Secreted protein n=1 Tax=Legionella gratiana TaxID=45066 RepID=A0A378JKP7_9GAMM|nr:hypothetical protein [Legionella gratiana]KTD06470.1 secreted protein [Legionella gratiana]STX45290.1 secreted protein [Legionella gratiana]
MKNIFLIIVQLAIAIAAFADTTIITETKTWKSVPITVNPQAHTYITVEGPIPQGEYYYTYPGYRCVKEKVAVVGGNVIIYHSGVPGGNDIYCYPE